MKMIILRDYLVKAVREVMAAVTSKPTIPILIGIKFRLAEDGLYLTASDTELSIESFVPTEKDGEEIIDIKTTGAVVLPAKLLYEIVKKLPAETVTMEVKEQLQTSIRSGKSKFNINGLDADEFPHLPQIEGDPDFQISGEALKKIIRQTAFAADTSETRPILTGVNWKLDSGVLTCVATDSHRLSMKKIHVNVNNFETYDIVIPAKSLVELTKVIHDKEAVQIVITHNQVLFKTGDLLFYTRLLEGNYPDTSRLIPTGSKTQVKIKPREFLSVIDRASLVSKEGRNNVVQLATDHDNLLQVSCNAASVGKVIEEVVSESLVGDPLKIGFSSKYMIDALRVVETEDVVIHFNGNMRPFILKSETDDSAVQLILPVRTV